MGKYFTITELTKSKTAKQIFINNTPTDEQVEMLNALIDNVLDPLREAYGKPIYVNSGFRCEQLNKLVGGAKNSHHLCKNGYSAADISTKTKKGNRLLFQLAQELNLPFAELGDESNFAWVHISYNPNDTSRQVFRA